MFVSLRLLVIVPSYLLTRETVEPARADGSSLPNKTPRSFPQLDGLTHP